MPADYQPDLEANAVVQVKRKVGSHALYADMLPDELSTLLSN